MPHDEQATTSATSPSGPPTRIRDKEGVDGQGDYGGGGGGLPIAIRAARLLGGSGQSARWRSTGDSRRLRQEEHRGGPPRLHMRSTVVAAPSARVVEN